MSQCFACGNEITFMTKVQQEIDGKTYCISCIEQKRLNWVKESTVVMRTWPWNQRSFS